MAKRKTPQSSIGKVKAPKIVYEDHFDIFTLRQKPVSDGDLENKARDLIEWVTKTDRAYKIKQWLVFNGISGDTLKRWRARSEVLDEAYKYALMVLGNRREVGWLEKKLDPTCCRLSMPIYDADWKKMEIWRAKLGDDSQSKGNITVICPDFADSEMVPERKVSDGR